ncbi:hypothetical protein [Niastella populi]|uniref:hypothetical protein n=1 Tax=Niastella populi TaxID=550983 RepID=UPI0013FDD8D1|nr:hypothetical protein [Niastella populi]
MNNMPLVLQWKKNAAIDTGVLASMAQTKTTNVCTIRKTHFVRRSKIESYSPPFNVINH